jgi:periodic tryptophan protein 1
MSLITCLSWVPKGYAIPNPTHEKVTSEDLAEIKEGELGMDLENYDKEDSMPEFANVEYDPQLENYKDEEDEEENLITANDCVLVTGLQNGDFSELQVYIYVQETSSLYIHHDIILPAYPLCLEWLPYNPSIPNAIGNCLATGSFLPEIEIWNLDVIDVLEPVARLGGVKREQSKSGKKRKKTVRII